MKNNVTFKILLLLIVLFTNSCKKDAQEYGDIIGAVRDAATSLPLSGVLVSVNGYDLSSTTNIDGYFSIANVPVGDLILVTSKTGYVNSNSPIIVVSNQSATITIAIAPSW